MKKFLAGSIIGVFTLTSVFSVGPSSNKTEENGYYSHNKAQKQQTQKKTNNDGYYSYKEKPKSKRTENDGYYSDQRRKDGSKYSGNPSNSEKRSSPCKSQNCDMRKEGTKGPDFEKEKKEPSSMVL